MRRCPPCSHACLPQQRQQLDRPEHRLARVPVFGVAHLGAGDAAVCQPGLHGGGVVFGDVEGSVDQVGADGNLDDVAACEVAFKFGPWQLSGFEIEFGAEDVAGGGHVRSRVKGMQEGRPRPEFRTLQSPTIRGEGTPITRTSGTCRRAG